LFPQSDRSNTRENINRLLTDPAADAELIAARAALGMADGGVILGPSHPLVLECIASGQELVIIPQASKKVSIVADPNKPTAVEFRNWLGE
jgi:hypothetical protein